MAKDAVRPLLGPVMRRLPGRQAQWGTMRRAQPFSTHAGYDRGTPVDRYYIERFLRAHRSLIRGDVLEVKSSAYTRRFGGPAVARAHVVDIDPTNPRATLVCDLTQPAALPMGAYDSIVLTQTLQFVVDPEVALENLWGALRPGATMLITVPCLAAVDRGLAASDYWRWTPLGLGERLRRDCPGARISVAGQGNLLSGVAFLYGLAAEELTPSELEASSAEFPVVACASVAKAPEPVASAGHRGD